MNHETNCTVKDEKDLIVKFGVITDVQYADVANRAAWYDATKTRYYRSSLQHVERASHSWTQQPDGHRKPSFVLQLGDLIDGISAERGLDSVLALKTALNRFHLPIPVFHVVGNHELYNFKRRQLVSLLRESLSNQKAAVKGHHDDDYLYYSFRPAPGVKLVALDCFEISVLGYDIGDQNENCAKAAALLLEKHGRLNYELWDTSGQLKGLEVRYQMQNGAISSKQLEWLNAELADSDSRREKVIVFGHVCLLPESCDPTCLLWNYGQVIACFAKHPSVAVYLSGHAHTPGHGIDASGVHYLVFNGVIETTPDSASFSTLSLYPDRLEVRGHGAEHSMNLKLAARHANASSSPANNKVTDNEVSENEA